MKINAVKGVIVLNGNNCWTEKGVEENIWVIFNGAS